ncbi:MAG: type IV toxin-antitoxin system AbiEi family antitoxin domain-containing protein [Bacteroidetes bacterium]|nr:type IV toxin-antitoxin system AbiEi family antitoxin domain-containing protein [Bacteroidota bacterium]
MPEIKNFPIGRVRLATVLKDTGKIVRIGDVEQSLGVDRITASKLLSRWCNQGWFQRAGPGVYAAVDPAYLMTGEMLDDPWMIVPALFDPAYVGGRSAAEYWGLTDQIFRDTVVLTGRTVRSKHLEILGLPYTLKYVQPNKIFGLDSVWFETTKVDFSDVHRTMLDILDDPSFGGGIDHVVECFQEYLRHEHRNDNQLIAYAERLGNGAIFKRLGFLAERESDTSFLVDACRERMTTGNAKLWSEFPCDRLVTRWRIFVPQWYIS